MASPRLPALDAVALVEQTRAGRRGEPAS